MKENHTVFDIDLPEANRTQANMWKLHCLEYIKELSKANKGLRRLSRRYKILKTKCLKAGVSSVAKATGQSHDECLISGVGNCINHFFYILIV